MANPFDIDVFGDYNAGDWTEILGEQNRGGQDVLGNAMNAAANPAFRAALARQAAANSAAVRVQAPTKARDWTVPFESYGTVGQTVTITQQPQCLFRGEKLIVNEIGSSTNGFGTKITGATIGQKNQMPTTSGGMLSKSFANDSLGNGIKWDTCQPALTISLTVSFLQTCTFYASLYGKAVLG